MLINPIPVPIARLAPDPEMFAHPSDIHGQPHVARVILLGFLLVERLKLPQEAARLWAAANIHDLGRQHDGRCYEHGRLSLDRFKTMPQLRQLFTDAGVAEDDYGAIEVAVTNHCLPEELPQDHPHWQLTALLKDSDGLDRVRLGDLKPEYLRFSVSRELVPFAHALYEKTQWTVETGAGYTARIWPIAQELARLHLSMK